MTLKYFAKPFANGGDKTAVPDNAQPDGSVSYDTGWTYDYERNPDPTIDPLTKDIPRDQSNQLAYDITSNLKFIQDFTAPEWSSLRGGYPRNARVALASVVYISTVDANTSTPGISGTWITTGDTDPTLVAIANLTPGANQYIYFTGTDIAALASITSFGRDWNAAANAGVGLGLLGITTAGTSTDGLVSFATDAQVNAGTNSPIVANPRQLRMGLSISLLANGYVLLPSWLGGWGIAWGTVNVPRNGNQYAFLPFPTSCLAFGAGFAQDMGRGDISCGAQKVDNTRGLVYYHRDSGGPSVDCWYFAVGY